MQQGLAFALEALSDFHFNALDATVNYTPDGELDVGLALKGSNPAVERGRPIHYNLNVSQNLLMLLRSLQLGSQLSERVEQKLAR